MQNNHLEEKALDDELIIDEDHNCDDGLECEVLGFCGEIVLRRKKFRLNCFRIFQFCEIYTFFFFVSI